MKWLIRDLKHALEQLKRPETWMVIGLLSAFGLLAYAVARFAFRTDSILRFLRHSVASCRELSNGPIIFLFCGMIFFLLAAVVTLGEFQRYFRSRRIGAYHEEKQALLHGIGWGIVALGIPLSAMMFFNNYCY